MNIEKINKLILSENVEDRKIGFILLYKELEEAKFMDYIKKIKLSTDIIFPLLVVYTKNYEIVNSDIEFLTGKIGIGYSGNDYLKLEE